MSSERISAAAVYVLLKRQSWNKSTCCGVRVCGLGRASFTALARAMTPLLGHCSATQISFKCLETVATVSNKTSVLRKSFFFYYYFFLILFDESKNVHLSGSNERPRPSALVNSLMALDKYSSCE
jgi:hypothetical protein